MIRRTFCAPSLAAALLLGAAAPAQEPAAPPTGAETITIIGRASDMSLRDYASEFVLEVGDPVTSNNGYARWEKRLCVGVIGAPADSAQFVADRISEVALELGLRPKEPGCTPDLLIIFAPDAAAMAGRLVEEHDRLLRPFDGQGGTTQGLAALEDFATSDAAVRWWQVTVPVDWRGHIAIRTPDQLLRSQLDGPPVVAGANSNILNGVKDAFLRAYIIVDTTKIVGLGWTELADYLAMVSLAQIDPDGNAAGYDSVLNLFASPSSVHGLTEWDWTYLDSLYELDRRLMPRNQQGALTGLIARNQEETGQD